MIKGPQNDETITASGEDFGQHLLTDALRSSVDSNRLRNSILGHRLAGEEGAPLHFAGTDKDQRAFGRLSEQTLCKIEEASHVSAPSFCARSLCLADGSLRRQMEDVAWPEVPQAGCQARVIS